MLLELTPSEKASQESSWVEDFSDFSELSDKFLLSTNSTGIVGTQ